MTSISYPPQFGLPAFAVTLTANAYTTTVADSGKVAQVTTGASDATITLGSASAAGNNALIAVQKVDSNSVTITGAADNGSGLVRLAFTSSPATTTFHTGDLVKVNQMVGVPQNGTWACTAIDTTHIDLQGSTFSGTYSSGGTIRSGKVIVTDGATDLAWLFQANDIVWLRSNGSAWDIVDWTIKPWQFVYCATATWTTPPLLSEVSAYLIGGGGGGGSGRSRNTGVAGFGGGAGASGCEAVWTFTANALSSSSYTVTVGVPAAGGAGVTGGAGASTDGNAGTAGNPSSFAGITAFGGLGGGAGLAASGLSGASQGSLSPFYATKTSNSASGSGKPGTGALADAAPSGSGGSVNSSNTGFSAGDGSVGSQTATSGPAAGTGGDNTGTNGTDGGSITDTDIQTGGAGAGGGGSNPAGAGGNGGNGGAPGAPGAGGGACLTENKSGDGGYGARGEVRLLCRFW